MVRRPGGKRRTDISPEHKAYLRQLRFSLTIRLAVIVLFSGSLALDYYEGTSLRLTRRLEYLRDVWSAVLPIEALAVFGVVVTVLAYAAVGVLWVRSGKLRSKTCIFNVVAAVLLTASFVCYAIGYSPQDKPAYVLVVPIMGVAVLLHNLAAAQEIRRKPDEWESRDDSGDKSGDR